MRISDWSSDVCSSDLYFPFLFLGHIASQLLRSEQSRPNVSEIVVYKGFVSLESLPIWIASDFRSEERRVGTECVSTCGSRWSPNTTKKKLLTNSLLHKRTSQKQCI